MTMASAIGILGGSFNPVHLGHTRLAELVQARCAFSPLYIVPTKTPAHKPAYDISDNHRLEMVNLAFAHIPNTEISHYEIESEGTSYAIRTIEFFTRKHPGTQIFFILGADAFNGLPEWYAFPDVLEACSYLVVNRAGWDQQPAAAPISKLSRRLTKLVSAGLLKPFDGDPAPFERMFVTRSGTRVCVLDAELPEVSSTEVRLRLQLGESVDGLVPDAVARYLKSFDLYGSPKS